MSLYCSIDWLTLTEVKCLLIHWLNRLKILSLLLQLDIVSCFISINSYRFIAIKDSLLLLFLLFNMDLSLELDNGLPRYFTDAELTQIEDRLSLPVTAPGSEPSSGNEPLTSEPSSGNIFEPDSDGNLPSKKQPSVDIDYKRQAVVYWMSGKKKRLSIASVQFKFKKVKSRGRLQHWARQISLESRSKKLRTIVKKTLEAYNKVCLISLTVTLLPVYRKKEYLDRLIDWLIDCLIDYLSFVLIHGSLDIDQLID